MSYVELENSAETKPSAGLGLVGKPGELFAAGDTVGGYHQYQIKGVLGRGAMSCVYEAYDPTLERMVAIKALEPGGDSERLHKEAVAIASLRHGSLVSIYGAGEHQGVPYLVMERLYGLTLREYIDTHLAAGGCAVAEALEILAAVAEVLDCIHRHGIVHRDLKPDNIMMETGGRVVLLDFGLFSPIGAAHVEMSGTPYYMAPETVSRGAGMAMPTVDIYALGVIAFELLTGRRPFEGRRIDEVLKKHLSEAPPELAAEHAVVCEHTSRLVHEMLAKDPGDRPPSAVEVAMWLRALQSGETVRERAQELSVLIVDDDPAMSELMSVCVQHVVPEAQIRTASDGAEALTVFRNQPPQMMIMDVNMPRMSGIELCSYLRSTKLSARTAIVAVSGQDDDHRRRRLAQLGVTEFLGKRQQSHRFTSALMNRITAIANMYRVRS